MSDQASPDFKLVAAEYVRSQIKRLGQVALRAGQQQAFEADLDAAQHRLTTSPLEWGDPIYRLHAMGLTMYHAMSDFLNVHYAVDEARRIVYLKEVTLMPDAGFPLN